MDSCKKEKAGELGAVSGMFGLYAGSLSDGCPRRVRANDADGRAFAQSAGITACDSYCRYQWERLHSSSH